MIKFISSEVNPSKVTTFMGPLEFLSSQTNRIQNILKLQIKCLFFTQQKVPTYSQIPLAQTFDLHRRTGKGLSLIDRKKPEAVAGTKISQIMISILAGVIVERRQNYPQIPGCRFVYFFLLWYQTWGKNWTEVKPALIQGNILKI